MKALRILAGLLVLATASFVSAAESAAAKDSAKKEKGPPEWAELFGNASLPVVWQSATAASEKIAAALADKKVDGIPDWAETIHLACHALQSQAKVENADRQADLADACRLAARIADDVTAAAWANDVAKTNTAHQRVKLALAIAQRNLPKDIVDAPPQAVRIAKKERREATGKK
jgi:hypothetical protein